MLRRQNRAASITSRTPRSQGSPRPSLWRSRIAAVMVGTLVAGGTLVGVAAPARAEGCPLSGIGSSESPYLVASAAHLSDVGVGSCELDAHYLQTANIVLAAPVSPATSNHTRIGLSSGVRFTGTYDGNGMTITGLTMTTSGQGVGLFGFVAGATLKDITLVDVNIESPNTDVGALVGRADQGGPDNKITTITGSSVTGASTVRGANKVGGLVGYLNGGGSISGSSAASAVTGSNHEIGGLVGFLDNEGTITDSHATGNVSGLDKVGGLVGGKGFQASITRASATGEVSGRDQVGGLVGRAGFQGSVSDAYATGEASGRDQVGGLIGDMNSVGSITRSYATGDVTGNRSVGGLVGAAGRGTITYSYVNSSKVLGRSGNGFDGSRVGGLVGFSETFSEILTIDNSYVGPVSEVTGVGGVGGLIGQASPAEIKESYSAASITGTTDVGRFIGRILSTGTRITDSFAKKALAADADGFTGAGDVAAFTITRSSAKIALDLQDINTYTSAGTTWKISEGWTAFNAASSVWGICTLANEGYPFLLWEGSDSADPCTERVVVAPQAPIADLLLPAGQPVISGVAQPAGTVTCTAPAFSSTPSSVQFVWSLGGVEVARATRTDAPFASTFTLASTTSPGGVLVCAVTAATASATGSVSASVAITAAPPTPPVPPTPPTPTNPPPVTPPAGTSPTGNACRLTGGSKVVSFASLSSRAPADLTRTARALTGRGCVGSFEVTGYVQPTRTTTNDAALSRARAQSVVAVLRQLHPQATFRIVAGGSKRTALCTASQNRCAVVRTVK
jgi:hypothetical protein